MKLSRSDVLAVQLAVVVDARFGTAQARRRIGAGVGGDGIVHARLGGFQVDGLDAEIEDDRGLFLVAQQHRGASGRNAVLRRGERVELFAAFAEDERHRQRAMRLQARPDNGDRIVEQPEVAQEFLGVAIRRGAENFEPGDAGITPGFGRRQWALVVDDQLGQLQRRPADDGGARSTCGRSQQPGRKKAAKQGGTKAGQDTHVSSG
ncbi:MAG: hypothetical protein WDM96_12415 [Lacunisphaera sp.]